MDRKTNHAALLKKVKALKGWNQCIHHKKAHIGCIVCHERESWNEAIDAVVKTINGKLFISPWVKMESNQKKKYEKR